MIFSINLDVMSENTNHHDFIPVPKFSGYYIKVNTASVWSIKSGMLRPLKRVQRWRQHPAGYSLYRGGRQYRLCDNRITQIINTTPKKPTPVLLDDSTKQQASAWESIFATLQEHVTGWNQPDGSARDNACNAIVKLVKDSKMLTSYRDALGADGCVAVHHMMMLDEKDRQDAKPVLTNVKAVIPQVVYKKSGIFCYHIKACVTPTDVKSELERVCAEFNAGATDPDQTIEVVCLDVIHRQIKVRWIKKLTKEKIVEFAQVKLQQIINDYIGEQK